MKFQNDQYFSLDSLKGAVITAPDSSEFRIIEFEINLTSHQLNVIVLLTGGETPNARYTIPFEDIKDWAIQFQPLY